MGAIRGLVNDFIFRKNNGCTLSCIFCSKVLVREVIHSLCKTANLDSIEFESVKDVKISHYLEAKRSLTSTVYFPISYIFMHGLNRRTWKISYVLQSNEECCFNRINSIV